MSAAVLTFRPDGDVTGLYTEAIPLTEIGSLRITRATSIEFNNNNQLWELKDTEGKVLFENQSRAVCLAWEQEHFNQ